MTSWTKLLTVSAFLLLLLPFSTQLVSASSEDTVTLALTEAEETLASAYEAVLEAEQAGTNASVLMSKLNLGAEYLAEAYVWHRLGVSENASRFASLCYEAVGDVRSEAVELRDEAKRLGETDLVVKIFGSVVGVIAVTVLCFVGWSVFKRRYRRWLLGVKPEVASSES